MINAQKGSLLFWVKNSVRRISSGPLCFRKSAYSLPDSGSCWSSSSGAAMLTFLALVLRRGLNCKAFHCTVRCVVIECLWALFRKWVALLQSWAMSTNIFIVVANQHEYLSSSTTIVDVSSVHSPSSEGHWEMCVHRPLKRQHGVHRKQTVLSGHLQAKVSGWDCAYHAWLTSPVMRVDGSRVSYSRSFLWYRMPVYTSFIGHLQRWYIRGDDTTHMCSIGAGSGIIDHEMFHFISTEQGC